MGNDLFKQVGYIPRSNSRSMPTSGDGAGKGTSSSQNSEPAAVKGGTGATPTLANNPAGMAGRRRSSASEKFSGLDRQKRSSGDAKMASFLEQRPGGNAGVAGLWNKVFRGA